MLAVTVEGANAGPTRFEHDKVVLGGDPTADVVLAGEVPARLATVYKVGRHYYLVYNGPRGAADLDGTTLFFGLSYPLREDSVLRAYGHTVKLAWSTSKRHVEAPKTRVISLDILESDDALGEGPDDLGSFMTRLLFQTTRALAGKQSLEDLAQSLARIVMRALPSAERVLVRLAEIESVTPRTFVSQTRDATPVPEQHFMFAEPVIDAAMVSKTAMLLTEKVDGGSALAVALCESSHVNGVVYLENDRGRPAFDERDALVLTVIANIAAIGVANTLLLSKLGTAETQLREENRHLQAALKRSSEFSEIVGESPAMKPLFIMLNKVVQSDVTVLIQGETGTGKERIARAIHFNGRRKNLPFVAINCAALTETLLESELFGHEKGAFTGADAAKRGLFEQANKGTLFLDEIGDISPTIQVRLLRVLQEGEIRPVGSTRDVKVDVRVLTATHRDLEELVRTGKFREDLLYRLNIISLHVPALRNRREDIKRLVEHFLKKHGGERDVRGVTPATMDLLEAYEYPGNIRELENEIQRAIVIAPDGGTITPELLSAKFHRTSDVIGPMDPIGDDGSLKSRVADFERAIIVRALEERGWNRSKTARDLGLSRPSFLEKLKKYKIDAPSYEPG